MSILSTNVAARLSWRLSTIACLALLCACEPPQPDDADLMISAETINLAPGQSVTFTAWSARDTDRPAEYQMTDLPVDVTYSVDYRLQSPSTPHAARITVSASEQATANSVNAYLIHIVDSFKVAEAMLRVNVAETHTFGRPVSIAAGAGHQQVVLDDGSVVVWGENFYGSLGTGDRDTRARPVRNPTLSGIRSVAAGHRSWSSAAIDTDGQLWTWGQNHEYQLSRGSAAIRATPDLAEVLPTIDKIEFGEVFAIALSEDGRVFTWGGADDASSPVADWREPTEVEGLDGVIEISAGFDHVMALTSDGEVWAWGENGRGQLATGDTIEWRQPQRIVGLGRVTAIAAGSEFSIVVTEDGSVWAWGANGQGQLGANPGADAITPRPVPGLAAIETVAAGIHFGTALATDGSVSVWGNVPGYEEINKNSGVVRLARPDGIVSIAAGRSYMTALGRCGQLWTWGYGLALGRDDLRLSRAQILAQFLADDDCEQFSITVERIGLPGRVDDDLEILECGGALCMGSYDRATAVALTAEGIPTEEDIELAEQNPNYEQSEFVRWGGDCSGTDPEQVLLADRTLRCTAEFGQKKPDPYLLRVVAENGSVTSTGGSVVGSDPIDCGDTCGAIFRGGTDVTLTATPAELHQFEDWSGDCSGMERQITVTVDDHMLCRANFRSLVPQQQYELRVGTSGIGSGRIYSENVPGIECPGDCSEIYVDDSVIRIVAEPSPGSIFAGWSEASHPSCQDGPASISVRMDEDKLCIAVFSVEGPGDGEFTIRMVIPSDGIAAANRVVSYPGGIGCEAGAYPQPNVGLCETFFLAPEVRLIAEPASGDAESFGGWSDNCFEEEPTVCLIQNPGDGSTIEVTATFLD